MHAEAWQLKWHSIVDSIANEVGLPDLGIGSEVTCDVLSLRIPGS